MESIEKSLEHLNDILSRKQIETFEIVGKCDKNGQIVSQMPFQMEFKDKNTYYVSLIELTTTSFFPNVTEANNKFFYSFTDSGKQKQAEITIPTGAYDVDDYNQLITMSIPKVEDAATKAKADPITIALHKPTGKVIINLLAGYKVHFNKEKTFRAELGFDSVILADKENISPRMADIVKVQKVYVSCDICRGSYLNGKGTNIIYSFPNEKRYGYPLFIMPTKRQYKQLNKKSFNKIIFTFTDENGNPVDFQEAVCTITIECREI